MRGILPAMRQSGLQRLNRRRQNENAYCVGIMLTNLARALPIDLEQNIFALGKRRVDPVTRSAVKVAVDFSPFQQGAIVAQGQKIVSTDESIVLVGLLAR